MSCQPTYCILVFCENSIIQLVSQVLPLSFEKACSHRGLQGFNEIHLNLIFQLHIECEFL